MKKWIAKAVVQKTISYLPFGHSINEQFQKWITKGIYLTEDYFKDRLEHAKNHIDFFRQLKGDAPFQTTLEIGTGWYPVVPISLYLSGAERIISIDISTHTNRERLQLTIEKFLEFHENGTLKNYLNYDPVRIQKLKNLIAKIDKPGFDDIAKQLHIQFTVGDARKLEFIKENEVDLITSNNTFEHIYSSVLIDILKEFRRVVKRDGIMSHFVDMSDHFAHFDKSITVYNFLQFSDGQWKAIDNSIQPQNRLRLTDYRNIYSDLSIPISLEVVRPGELQQLQSIKLDKRFASMPEKDLAITHCYMVSKMSKL